VSEGPGANVVPRARITLRTLHQHPAPRYLVSGTATFLVDIGSLKVLHGVFGIGLALSTVLAFAVAFAVNFTAARKWTFVGTAREGKTRSQLVRYLVLVAVNLGSTVLIVVGLSGAGLSYLVAKVVAASINAVGNFFAYRHWVFAAQPVL
jgi:putative flippase GtrA